MIMNEVQGKITYDDGICENALMKDGTRSVVKINKLISKKKF